MLVVVLGLFALPFLTVGCVPTRYGSQSAGGSTEYTGYQLALVLVAVALVVSFVVTDPRTRRLTVAATAGLAAAARRRARPALDSTGPGG